MFLMGIGFAITLVTSGSSQIAPPLLTCRASPVQSPPGFPQPQVRQSLSGLLRTTFTACISPQVMLDQNQVPPVTVTFHPPTFEGTIPAPTLSVKPRDKLKISLVNNLPGNLVGERAAREFQRIFRGRETSLHADSSMHGGPSDACPAELPEIDRDEVGRVPP